MNDPQNDKPSALLRMAMRLYNSGYHAGHHDSVEAGYVDIFSSDMENYHQDEAQEIVQNFLGSNLTDQETRDIQTIFDDAPLPQANAATPPADMVQRLKAEAEDHQTVYSDDRRRKALFAEAAEYVTQLRADLERTRHERNRAGVEARKEMMRATPAPAQGSAVEWAEKAINDMLNGAQSIPGAAIDNLRALARRCDEAEKRNYEFEEWHGVYEQRQALLHDQLAAAKAEAQKLRDMLNLWKDSAATSELGRTQAWSELRTTKAALAAAKAEAAAAQSETTALRVSWKNAEEREKQLHIALEWLEENAPSICHDSWTHSVDMGGNRWTLNFRNDGKRERIRGRTLIETINRARAALQEVAP